MDKRNVIIYSMFALLFTVMAWTGFLLLNYVWIKFILGLLV